MMVACPKRGHDGVLSVSIMGTTYRTNNCNLRKLGFQYVETIACGQLCSISYGSTFDVYWTHCS